MQAFILSASGMAVQRKRMDIAAENMANTSSTSSPEGGPYRKKSLVVESVPLSFDAGLEKFLKKDDVQGAAVTEVIRSDEPFRVVHDPSHPHADKFGNVSYPNVNGSQEMIDIMTASRSYKANITAYNAAKNMVLRTLDIGS